VPLALYKYTGYVIKPRITFWAFTGLAFGKGSVISASFIARKEKSVTSSISFNNPKGKTHQILWMFFETDLLPKAKPVIAPNAAQRYSG
jgi:hypothetical protein